MDIDGFWLFLERSARETTGPQHWYQLAARNPDNRADNPAVQALAGRRPIQWANAEWPEWEELAYVASRVHDHVTGQEDSIADALALRGHRSLCDPAPTDPAWDFGSLTEIQRRLPRLAGLFPRRQSNAHP